MSARQAWLGAAAGVAVALLAACGGGNGSPPPAAPPVAAEPENGRASAGDRAAEPARPPERAEPPAEPARGPAGAIVELEAGDLAPGFDGIPFYVDIPGLLRESPDGNLASLGLRAAVPQFSGGQGFANRETGELVFVITILLDSADDAEAAVDYIGTRTLRQVLSFVEPRDTLFESERQPDPLLGSAAVHYFLRYGVEEADARSRDVTTDLMIFAEGGSLVFLQRSVNVAGDDLSAAQTSQRVDLLGLGATLRDRIAEAIREGATGGQEAAAS